MALKKRRRGSIRKDKHKITACPFIKGGGANNGLGCSEPLGGGRDATPGITVHHIGSNTALTCDFTALLSGLKKKHTFAHPKLSPK